METLVGSPKPLECTLPKASHMTPPERRKRKTKEAHFAEDEYLVTALVPSETACFASSPGRINRTLLEG